jgi:hypothetical protein
MLPREELQKADGQARTRERRLRGRARERRLRERAREREERRR